jgi:transaldolase
VLDQLKIKIFGDGADLEQMLELANKPYIRGFDEPGADAQGWRYRLRGLHARRLLDEITDRPISFEVFTDRLDEIHTQAREISSWAPNNLREGSRHEHEGEVD